MSIENKLISAIVELKHYKNKMSDFDRSNFETLCMIDHVDLDIISDKHYRLMIITQRLVNDISDMGCFDAT